MKFLEKLRAICDGHMAASFKSNKGFTLIELLVIFSITATLSGIGAVSLSTYSQSQQMAQTANDIKLLIQEARFNAISSVNTATNDDGDDISCGARRLNGYLAKVDLGLNRVQLFMSCENALPFQMLVKSYEIKSPLIIAPSTTCDEVHFDSLTSLASGVPCEIVLEGFGGERAIMVDSGGNIFVN